MVKRTGWRCAECGFSERWCDCNVSPPKERKMDKRLKDNLLCASIMIFILGTLVTFSTALILATNWVDVYSHFEWAESLKVSAAMWGVGGVLAAIIAFITTLSTFDKL